MHLCTIVPISYSVGANRIYAAVAIPHPAGYPNLEPKDEFESRVDLVQKALECVTKEVNEQTIYGKM